MLSEGELRLNKKIQKANDEKEERADQILIYTIALGIIAAEKADYLHENPNCSDDEFAQWCKDTYKKRKADQIEVRAKSAITKVVKTKSKFAIKDIKNLIEQDHKNIEYLIQTTISDCLSEKKKQWWQNFTAGIASNITMLVLTNVTWLALILFLFLS